MDRERNKRQTILRGSMKEYFRNDILDFWVPFETQGAVLNTGEYSIDNSRANTINTAQIDHGTFGTAAFFAANTIEAWGTTAMNYEYTQPFSGIVWAVCNATANRYQQIVTRGKSSTPYTGWFFFKTDDSLSSVIAFQLINSAAAPLHYIYVYGSTNIKDTRLHCLGFSYDGSGLEAGCKLFVDGKPETLTNAQDTLANNSTLISGIVAAIGNRDTPATNLQGWDGSIEEVAIIKRNLDNMEHALYYEWAKPRYL